MATVATNIAYPLADATLLSFVVAVLFEVRRAAALHDIGKVAIPDSILQAPRALTEDEWRYMRQHTLIGERIIAAAPELAGVARIVRSSHERYDGGACFAALYAVA